MAINNQPTIEPRTVTGIFTRYIAKTLPLAFDESMSYYECLCALLEYINTKVVPALDNNAAGLKELQEFYEELQSYVNNYFDNLDVQEEINNKLDDMVEAGTLQEIIADYLNSQAIFGYDNVSDMQSATNLLNGSFAKTLGYYSKNDGGEGLYKIRTITNDDVVDGGSIIAMNDNTLVAELIVSDNINIKQFGAKGDGIQDDTSIIQNALNYVRNKVLNENIGELIPVIFPSGNYKVTSTITLSPFVKIKTSGMVTLLSYVGNGSCLHITHQSGDENVVSLAGGTKADWFRGSIINAESGLIIADKSESNSSVGIEIGSRSNLDVDIPTARMTLNDIRLRGFNTGFLFNIYHNYIHFYQNISFEECTIGVKYAATSSTAVDSGERLTFSNCIFSGNKPCFLWNVDGFDTWCDNCSFDFNKAIFYDPNDKGYHNIVINNSHIEGIYDSTKTVPYGIVDTGFKNSTITITNCEILYTNWQSLFNNISDRFCDIILKNNQIKQNIPGNNCFSTFEPLNTAQFLVAENNSLLPEANMTMYSKSNLYVIPNEFNALTTGVYDASGTPHKVGSYTIEVSNVNLSTGLEIVENEDNTKHLKVSPTDPTAGSAVILISDYIPVQPNEVYCFNCDGYNVSSYTILPSFYRADKTKISDGSNSHNSPDIPADEWYLSKYMKIVKIPENCFFIKVAWQHGIQRNKDYCCLKNNYMWKL